MKISELIERLKVAQKLHGDIPVAGLWEGQIDLVHRNGVAVWFPRAEKQIEEYGSDKVLVLDAEGGAIVGGVDMETLP